MELVSKSIPNLIGGISQQPDSLRLPSQAQLQENCYSSVVEGLKERPPTEHIGKLFTGNIGDVFVHTINRDAINRFKLIIRNGDLLVSDLAGNLKTVTFPNGKTYLNATSPSASFRCVTVADYTFVVNTTVITAMLGTTSAVRPSDAIVFVKQGNYGSTYTVLISGVVKATYTTSATVVTDIATDNIATQLAAQLTTNLGVSYAITRVGNVVWIKNIVSGAFTLQVTDSQGGASLYGFQTALQNFTQLPTVAPNGFTISITPNPGVEASVYWVNFVTSDGSTFGPGSWNECVAPGIQYLLDPSTMPYALIHNVDGTFTFQQNTWTGRSAGDTATNPNPSFIGRKLNDIFFTKDRLGVAADDNIIMSQIGKFFNFFLTTVTTLVDSDRIDASVSHTKVSLINHVIPFDTQTMLFSDQTQFLMTGSPVLNSKTIQIDPTTEFENVKLCKPVAAGRRVFFVATKGGYDTVREYSIDLYTSVKDATDVTGHVPKYIPTGVFKMSVTTIEDCLAVLTTGQRDSVYLYKYFFVQQEKLQSSWSRIILGDNTTVVLDAEWTQTTLYVVVQRTDGVYLESMNFAPGVVDTGVNYRTCLDRRITDANCTLAYSSVTGQTTITLPYTVTGTMQIVTRQTSAGSIIPIVAQTPTTLIVNGDKTATTFWIGQLYTRTYTFSKFFVRDTPKDGQQNSGGSIVSGGRLQIRTLTVQFFSTGYFQILVTPLYRTTNTFTFTGKIIGSGSDLIGQINIVDGKFAAKVMSKNDQVTISVVSNSFLPMRLLSADWEGVFHQRAQRM